MQRVILHSPTLDAISASFNHGVRWLFSKLLSAHTSISPYGGRVTPPPSKPSELGLYFSLSSPLENLSTLKDIIVYALPTSKDMTYLDWLQLEDPAYLNPPPQEMYPTRP